MSIITYKFHVESSFQRAFIQAWSDGQLSAPNWVADWVFNLTDVVEAPGSILPRCQRGFVRPPRHRRSIYFSPIAEFDWVDGPVICIKGLEPAYPDFPSQLDTLEREGPNQSGMSLFEHFPIVEAKAPLALTRSEVYAEANSANLIHKRFQEAGLGMPRIPLPLAVFRHPEEVTERYARNIERRGAPHVAERILSLISEGIYCYLYYYPGPCSRLSDLASMDDRQSSQFDMYNVKDLTTRWINLFASLVSLGVIPATRIDRFTGSCFDVNNAVLDGGVVDVGSCVSSLELRSDYDVYQSLQISRAALARTIVRLRVGDNLNFRIVEYAEQLVSRLIDLAVRDRIGQIGAVDGRVSKFFCFSTDCFEELMAHCSGWLDRRNAIGSQTRDAS